MSYQSLYDRLVQKDTGLKMHLQRYRQSEFDLNSSLVQSLRDS